MDSSLFEQSAGTTWQEVHVSINWYTNVVADKGKPDTWLRSLYRSAPRILELNKSFGWRILMVSGSLATFCQE